MKVFGTSKGDTLKERSQHKNHEGPFKADKELMKEERWKAWKLLENYSFERVLKKMTEITGREERDEDSFIALRVCRMELFREDKNRSVKENT